MQNTTIAVYAPKIKKEPCGARTMKIMRVKNTITLILGSRR